MDVLLPLILSVLALVVLDLIALRFGADSRGGWDQRPEWW